MKERTDKLNFIKVKNTCLGKEAIKRMKRQVTDWGKLFEKKNLIKKYYPKHMEDS